jgi:hypothetical protein
MQRAATILAGLAGWGEDAQALLDEFECQANALRNTISDDRADAIVIREAHARYKRFSEICIRHGWASPPWGTSDRELYDQVKEELKPEAKPEEPSPVEPPSAPSADEPV